MNSDDIDDGELDRLASLVENSGNGESKLNESVDMAFNPPDSVGKPSTQPVVPPDPMRTFSNV